METAARWSQDPIELGEVHRFLSLGVDEAGMPVMVPDVVYGELSLAMRAGDAPEAVAEALSMISQTDPVESMLRMESKG